MDSANKYGVVRMIMQSLIPSCDFTNTFCFYNYTLCSTAMDDFA